MSGRSLMVTAPDIAPHLRRRIVEAAAALIRERGLAGATTREIARAAGCSEGSIYVHFEDKIDLVIAVIVEHEPTYAALLELPGKAGLATVEGNLAPWAEELLKLLADNQPLFFALVGDRAVFERFKARMRERDAGLVAVIRAVTDYVRAEQELGRVDAAARPEVVATLLVGGCRDRVLTRALVGADAASPSEFAGELVRVVVNGLAPAPISEEEPS
ncbi:MAG TPA: TetR/AcrR family transcriptional regulator [Gaiellaceae bacterium]|nr:TetR/AcrR family transcriptional regulator [Gaiellaceae bacterium]